MATTTLNEAEGAWDKIDAQFDELKAFVRQAVAAGTPLHGVERGLLQRLVALGRLLLEGFVKRSGTGYTAGQAPRTADDKPLEYKGIWPVRYCSIFGRIWLRRAGYALPQGGYVYPMDARWNRPAGRWSYLLQEWLQLNASEDDYRDAADRLNRMFGLKLVPNTPQRLTAAVGAQVDTFYEQMPAPAPGTEGGCIGVGGDGKGVRILRRDRDGDDAPAPEPKPRRGKGEKPNTKKESVVTTVFSFDPEARDPEEVVRCMMHQLTEERAERKDEYKRRRQEQVPLPREPLNGHARAGLDGKDAAYKRAMEQVHKRDPQGLKPIVGLMDGALALEPAFRRQLKAAGLSDRLDALVLDIWHAAEYVWEAGTALHGEGTPERNAWVEEKLRAVLNSRVGRVIGGMRQMRAKGRLKPAQERALEKAITYFSNHRHMMDYATYLAKGYPIGTGLVEGHCNSLVADRMECSGMRWSIAGADAMLQQRAVKQNDDWDAFWAYRTSSEKDRLYGSPAYKVAA